ncbi:hypothetical protein [Actinomadura roseirufa]|uniref:hypothetical protein n=1 Tax=Actinomadura roseirufa TaxID=2094049 RepID=UPI0013F15CC8|nr:hypothetical protein [Actinomadura roseirufa]
MDDDTRANGPRGRTRWHALPPRVPPEDLTTGQQVPPTPQAIAEAAMTPMDEATRYPC